MNSANRQRFSRVRIAGVAAFLGVILGGCGAIPSSGGGVGGLPGGLAQTSGAGGGSIPSLAGLPTPPVALPTFGGGQTASLPLGAGDSTTATSGASGTGPAAPGSIGAGVSVAGRSQFEVEVDRWMLAMINQERQSLNRQPVKIDPRLHEAAWKHTLDMFSGGYIDHQNKSGEWGHDRARREGFPVLGGLENVNENVADIFRRDDARQLALTAMNQYRQSDGHWQNLLDPKWNVVGLATICRPDQAKRDSYGEPMSPNTQLFGKL